MGEAVGVNTAAVGLVSSGESVENEMPTVGKSSMATGAQAERDNRPTIASFRSIN